MSCIYNIGTSGYYYEHWRNIFYPPELKKKDFFSFYQKKFNTVEINATFYHLPKLQTTANWASRSAGSFKFCIKMWRRITHFKKLREIDSDLSLFFERLVPLKSKVACILIQFPPNFKANNILFEEFVDKLSGYKFVVEFRDNSWEQEKIYTILKERNIALCAVDVPNLNITPVITADFLYIRFHGYKKLYGGDYPDPILLKWADYITAARRDAFVYFNNDSDGYAVKNALRLKEILNGNN